MAGQAQWCGKNYQQGQAALDPGGHFKQPAVTNETLLNFRCWPRLQPFIEGEDEQGTFIIDAALTNLLIPGAQRFTGIDHVTVSNADSSAKISVSIRSNNIILAQGTVPINSTGNELPFNLRNLSASMNAQKITCTASLVSSPSVTFKTTTNIQYLPPPRKGGSVTKQDFKTGALLVRSAPSASKASYEPILPFGFYTSWSDYLALNLSIVDKVKASGRNTIHPVPTYDNATAFQEVLERMKEQGVWLMYDMRGTFMNLTSVREQVEMLKDYPNLLLWYTADEPDGWEYPHNSTKQAGDLINSLDPYHPVSLVLNCFDYFFEEYTQGASVILQDTYTIDINATFSRVWGTPCNATLGDCGCDDCTGSFVDVATRVDMFNDRLQLDGRSRGISVWSVPQGFGNETYWPRYPTPQEFILQNIIELNHGSAGLISWDEDSNIPPELLDSAGILGKALPAITSVIFNPDVRRSTISSESLDIGVWVVDDGSHRRVMILGANLQTQNATTELGPAPTGGANITELLNTGATLVETNGSLEIVFTGLASFGFLMDV